MSEPQTEETSLSPPAVSELSASELRLERERCALDLERLGLERERLETERLRLQRERDLYDASGSNALRVGLWVLVLAVLVTLALGLLFGYTTGVDMGRNQSPPPRRIQVSRGLAEALRAGAAPTGAQSDDEPESRAPWFTLFTRPASDAAFGNLPIVR